jgi:hypothetical protein
VEEFSLVVMYANKNVLLNVYAVKTALLNVLIVNALKNVMKFVLIVKKNAQLDLFSLLHHFMNYAHYSFACL